LERYAFRYGLCFQLADDLEDLRGRAHLCRAPWQDLRDGVYTLPVLLALRVDASKGGRLSQMLRTIQERVDEDLVAGAAAVIAEYGVPDARATLGRWAASAKAALASVSSTESSTARRSLESLLATTLGQRGDHPASL
jgi:heptaprenyl diphosphate synthase